MPLSTFAARTFRADSFVAPLSQQRPEVVEQKPDGGVVLPFRKRAETPEVFIENKGLWQVEQPLAVVPPALYRTPVPTSTPLPPAPAPLPRPAPQVEQKSATVATPQFLSYAEYNVADVASGVTLGLGAVSASVNQATGDVTSGAVTTEEVGVNVSMYQTLYPATVRNPTDEELVAIALKLL